MCVILDLQKNAHQARTTRFHGRRADPGATYNLFNFKKKHVFLFLSFYFLKNPYVLIISQYQWLISAEG